MMHWHCANKRKGYRSKLADMQPHLGDVIGEPIRLRPTYSRTFHHPRWIERGVRAVVMTFGITVVTVLVIGVVVSLLFAAKKTIL